MNFKPKVIAVSVLILFSGINLVNVEANKMTNNDENKSAVKIVQTAGREQLGEFAPDFARYNDEILFGEVW